MDLATYHSIQQLLHNGNDQDDTSYLCQRGRSPDNGIIHTHFENESESRSVNESSNNYQLIALFSVLLYLLFSSRVPCTTRKSYISFWNCWVAFQFHEAPNGPCSQRRVRGCKCRGCPEIQTCGHSVWEPRKVGCSIPKVWGAMVDSVPTSSTRIESTLLGASGTGGNNEKGVWWHLGLWSAFAKRAPKWKSSKWGVKWVVVRSLVGVEDIVTPVHDLACWAC